MDFINKRFDTDIITGCHIYKYKNMDIKIGKGKTKIAYNMVWDYHNPNNKIEKGGRLLKTCNNKQCIFIDHLYLEYKNSYPIIWKRMLKMGESKDGCLLWKGYLNMGFYGQTIYKGKNILIHILSYCIKMDIRPEEIKKDQVIRHKCKNRNCFNPEHLEIGTTRENVYDDKIRDNTLPRGERSSNCKITEKLAREIKLSKYPKDHKNYFTQIERAEKFKVSLAIVANIDDNSSWSHLPDSDGNIKSNIDIRDKNNRIKEKAKERIWTPKMFEEARQKLLLNSELQSENNEFIETPCRVLTMKAKEIGIFGRKFKPHILSCSVKNGYHRPKNLITRHLCGNSNCIEQNHLEFGTHSENSKDTLKHQSNKRLKLNFEKAKEIKKKNLDGKSINTLAEEYNVTHSCINNIVKEISWKM